MLSEQRIEEVLTTWVGLNHVLMEMTDEDELHQLLDAELGQKRRKIFLLRIHSRLNKLRAMRERKEIIPNE